MSRQLGNFIDGFIKYTDNRGSPLIYRKWAAIFLLAAVMERKTWVRTSKGVLYPNMYAILVGGAGVGKSLCTSLVNDMLNEIRTPEKPFFLSPTSVTRASVIDELDNAQRRIIRPLENPSTISFNSLCVVPNEFGVFLPSWEADFMSVLTDLWDCGRYGESRRSSKLQIDIPRTQLNIFSATTPAQLVNLLPDGAWEQGFMSRVILIYSGDIIFTDLFAEHEGDARLWAKLVADLKVVYDAYGQLEVADDVKEVLNAWARSGAEPAPTHPKLTSYSMRRIAHLLKLMMVACMSSGDSKVITLEHYTEALDWLVEAESFMPDIFKSMKSGGDARAIDECWHYAYSYYVKKKEAVPEHLLFAFLQDKVPVHSVERILDVMQRAKLLNKQFAATGGIAYMPKPPNPS